MARRLVKPLNAKAVDALEARWKDQDEGRQLSPTEIAQLFATVRARERQSDYAWIGLQNLYSIITNQKCDKEVALGMATSAVDRLIKERDELQRQLAEARKLLNEAGGLAKLVVQTGGAWVHPGGSTIELSGADGLVMRIETALAIDARLTKGEEDECGG
jgi:hypothetical protein